MFGRTRKNKARVDQSVVKPKKELKESMSKSKKPKAVCKGWLSERIELEDEDSDPIWNKVYGFLFRDKILIMESSEDSDEPSTPREIPLNESSFISVIPRNTNDKNSRPSFLVGSIDEATNDCFSTEKEADCAKWVAHIVDIIRAGGSSERKRGLSFEMMLDDSNFGGKWMETEKERVGEIEAENSRLKVELDKQAKELVDLKLQVESDLRILESEKQKNDDLIKEYEELKEKYRLDAFVRNQGRRREEDRISKKIMALNRMTLRGSGDLTKFKLENDKYEKEIEKLQGQLNMLQKMLNVDFNELGWDGTLEQAEAKLEECLKGIIDGATEEIKLKAQTDFDRWDNLIRNHKDYIAREKLKWEAWETEQSAKNQEMLKEFKAKYVPALLVKGCSVEELIDATGASPRVAQRVWKTKIFKFLWFSPADIQKIHPAAFNTEYSSQGLDINELRAVYACLPKEFSNDSDGRKQKFRDDVRQRLFELTTKEKNGTLSKPEAMNGAYRNEEAKAPPKPKRAVNPSASHEVNSNLVKKSAALEEFFAGKSKPQGPPKIASTTAVKSEAPDLSKYEKMLKMSLPEAVVRQRMEQDGVDPELFAKLGKAKAVESKPVVVSTELKKPDTETKHIEENVVDIDPFPVRKKNGTKRGSKVKGLNTARMVSTRQQSIRKRDKDIGEFVDKASHSLPQQGVAADHEGKNTALLKLEYAQGKSRYKTMRKINTEALSSDKVLDEVVDIILTQGAYDEVEGGRSSITFGSLYDIMIERSEILAGILMKGKKKGVIKYRGDVLFKGVHDKIIVTVV